MASDWLLLRPPIVVLFPIIFILQFSLLCSQSDSEALIKLKESLTNANGLSSWVPGTSPCQGETHWHGVVCSNEIVTGLRLANLGLSGNIDIGVLAKVSGIRTISLSHNSFTGTIPELNRLGYLKSIFLSGNRFSGQIPSGFFSSMFSLKKIWLSDNNFTGRIPISLTNLTHLIELHLENNQFNGTIPPLSQRTLTSFNVSNNKLQGEIPPVLATMFNTTSFDGNPNLCTTKSGKGCNCTEDPALATDAIIASATGRHNHNHTSKIITGVITLSIMLLLIVAMVVFTVRRKEKKQNKHIEKDMGTNMDHSFSEVQFSVATKPKEMELSSYKKGGSGHGRSTTTGRGSGPVGEFVMVNNEKGSFGLPDLMKSAAEMLGHGALGSSYKAVMANGVSVVVKRLRDMNGLDKDGFDAELRKLGRLKHCNILPLLAFHYRKDEKLLVYEYMPKGSLLYLLHGDRGPSHTELNWPARLKIIQGIARGMGYLHAELASSELPHGNLKSSNILIGHDNEPLISEFGFQPLISPAVVSQTLFAYKDLEASSYGAVSPKCDVFCLGIIILEILTAKLPSQYVGNSQGGIDLVQWAESVISIGGETELLDPELVGSGNSISEMVKLIHIGNLCAQSNAGLRLDMRDAVERIEAIQLESSTF